MKISELIEQLQEIKNQDAEVIIARDQEGNGFSKFDGFSQGIVRPEELDSHRIESYYDNEAEEDEEYGLEPGQRDTFVKVICLWP